MKWPVKSGLRMLLPSYRVRDALRRSLVMAVDGKEDAARKSEVVETIWNMRQNRGGLVLPDMVRGSGRLE